MASLVKYQTFVQNLGNGHFNFGSDTLKCALTNTAPTLTHNTYSQLAGELTTGNGYTATGQAIGSVTWTNSTGTSTLAGNAVTWTASGGSIGPFEYVIVYDSTTGYLIGYFDYGSALTVTNGNTFTVDFNSVATAGTILTLS